MARMETTKEPAVFLMLPMFGAPYYEVFDAPPDFDAVGLLRERAADHRAMAPKYKGKGSRRAKAHSLRIAALCEGAIADWADDRCSRGPSYDSQPHGVLRISLAKRIVETSEQAAEPCPDHWVHEGRCRSCGGAE